MAVRLGRRLSQPQLNAKVNVVAETDGLHLSPLGSVVLGRRVAEVVQATLSKPCGRLEMGPMPQVLTPKEPGSQRARTLAYGDSLIAGFRQHGLRFTPYAQALTDELAPQIDAAIVMRGLSSLTAQQLASNVGARHVYDGRGRVGQGLGHILKEQGPFDLVIIMAGTNDLGGSARRIVAPLMAMQRSWTPVKLCHLVTCSNLMVHTSTKRVHDAWA